MAEVEGKRIEHLAGEPLALYPVDLGENLTNRVIDIPGFARYHVDQHAEHGVAYFATGITQHGQDAPQRIALKPFITADSEATPMQLRNAMVREHDVMAALYDAGLAVPRPLGFFEKQEPPKGSYLMTEYFGQYDLTELVESDGLSREYTMLYFQSLLEQVAEIHERGLVHRDIKPSNVRVTANGRIGFTDWGTVHRLRTSHYAGDNTADYPTGVVSQSYTPPDQVSHQSVPNVQADIFSLGMTLYFMREGHDPDPSWAISDSFSSALKGGTAVDEYPPMLREFMYKMTAYDPSRRYQSADNALADLREIIAQGQY